ncbi:response regulator [Salininema proteolyticum]|uniref:Response regulator n=1 Tax=Salininema proteolyticum TaxID=1607685 RepID=A0ABV8TTC4_9ACTN
MAIRIAVADDQAAVRAGLSMILDAAEDIDVVGEAADGREAVLLARTEKPDVVLMDVRMPAVDGIEACRRIAGERLAQVLVLTTFDLDEHVYAALKAGAAGFLLKTVDAQGLLDAVRHVAAGDAVIEPSVTRRLLSAFAEREPSAEPAGYSDLTGREREVLDLLGDGLSNRLIARSLHIEETTVKTHVSRVLTKLGVQSRVQAAVIARQARS